VSADTMSAMLIELEAAGWRPVVHPKTPSLGNMPFDGIWVAYPEDSVREFYIGEGPSPEEAVRALHRFAFTGPRPLAETPRPTAEAVLDAREERIRAAQAMGYVVGGMA